MTACDDMPIVRRDGYWRYLECACGHQALAATPSEVDRARQDHAATTAKTDEQDR